mmetsp:Transcript_9396/g.23061  ORF Transcript_9396/g.23061 Transcript_9396/m.23061 type:complete len:197 (+) Transcript_9396:127-717(+)
MTANTAPIKYAQRKDSLYLTIALADVKDEKIVLTDTELKFKGTSGDKPYEVNIKFFKEVDSEGSTYKVHKRSIQMHIMKKDKEEEEFWTRLLEDKALEKNQVKMDWDRYVDEDDDEEGFDMSNMEGGMGMPGMGGMGGMPGMGGGGGLPGGMDMEALMKQMGNMGGGAGMGGDDDDSDDDGDDEGFDDLPALEEAN